MKRRGGSWGLVCGSLLFALQPLAAAELRAFRMADHPDFTRLVFEFDTYAAYEIERDPGDRMLVVRLIANGRRELQRSWGPWVKLVLVEPLLDVTLVHVELRDPDVRVLEERLEAPPRIVLDVGPALPASSPARSAPPTPPAQPTSLPEADPAAESQTPPEPVASVPKTGLRAPLEASAALPPDVDPERVHDPLSIAAQLSDTERTPAPRAAPTAAPADLLERYGTFAALLAAAAVGLFAWRAGGLGWLLRRGVAFRQALFAGASRGRYEAAEIPAPPAREVPEYLPAVEDGSHGATPKDAMLDPPLESQQSPRAENPISEPTPGDLAGVEGSQLEALRRRVEALEFALERALQGRERLEARLAAQGEELRVQRAALARTQRAVRALSRSRDPRRDDRGLRG